MKVWIDDAQRDQPDGPITRVHIRNGSWWPVHKAIGAIKRPGSQFYAIATVHSPEAQVRVVDDHLCTEAGEVETSNLHDLADEHG